MKGIKPGDRTSGGVTHPNLPPNPPPDWLPVLQFEDVHVSARLDGIKVAGEVAGTNPGREVALLRHIDFSVYKGRTLGLVGESGAGKSMVGRVVSGLLPDNLRVSGGVVRFQGQPLTARAARAHLGKRIAFIPQEPLSALNPVFTVRQQMFEHLARLKVPRAQREAYCHRSLQEVGLADPAQMLGRYAHQLSGGQCQRILIAMAFAGEPDLIIADEPTTALDVVTQVQIIHLLREAQRRHGVAVILITHDLRLAAHLCDDVAVLYAGDMVERGPAAQVLAQPAHPYAQALKMATPSIRSMGDEPQTLPVLPDLMPGLRDLADLPGCRFAPRCPGRNALCEQSGADAMQAVGSEHDRHVVRCAGACLAQEETKNPSQEDAPNLAYPPPCDTPVWPAADSGTACPCPLLSLHSAGMQYRVKAPGQTRLFTALHPLSLNIHAGERVGVVGESGSGKSTLARVMAGLLVPTQGEVQVLGQPRQHASAAAQARMRATVQMVFQDPDSALNPRRTVMQLMTQVMELAKGVSSGQSGTVQRLQAARRLAAQVGMAQESLARFPAALSGGQKQRVNIARALCATPQLLIADEIVSGLDVSVQALILNLLRELNRELGIALVFISHDLSVIRYLCRRVLVMYRGQVVEQGPCAAVFNDPQHAYTRLLLASVPPDSVQEDWPPALAELDAQSKGIDRTG